MALVTEDGTGRADAESYASVADADTYHSSRGNSAWALLTETQKEVALRRASDFMAEYTTRLAGHRKTTAQALDWPRCEVPIKDAGGFLTGYYDSDSVPPRVKSACAELALKASTTTLAPDLKPPKLRAKVGPIETEYAQGARQTTTYRAVELLLAPFFCGSANSLRVSRA